MTHQKTVAVDLDGTLVRYDKWLGIHNIGYPLPGARTFLTELRELGCRIVIHTVRTNTAVNGYDIEYLVWLVSVWLTTNELPYDEIFSGIGKPIADFYVDDRAVRCAPQEDPDAYAKALDAIRQACK